METRIDNEGYEVLRTADRRRRQIYFHVVVVEKILGKPLPDGAVVHHSNRKRADNRPSNLVLCPSHAYHRLLHKRMIAKEASGKAWYLFCRYCRIHDDPKNMRIDKRNLAVHISCVKKHYQENRVDIRLRAKQWWVENKERVSAIRKEKRRLKAKEK